MVPGPLALLAGSLVITAAAVALCSRGRFVWLFAGLALAVAWGGLRLLVDPSLDEREAARLLLERGEAGFARYRLLVVGEALAPLAFGAVAALAASQRAVRRIERGER